MSLEDGYSRYDEEYLTPPEPEAGEPEEQGEHSKHPKGDYCVFCLSQWPCDEAPEDGL